VGDQTGAIFPFDLLADAPRGARREPEERSQRTRDPEVEPHVRSLRVAKASRNARAATLTPVDGASAAAVTPSTTGVRYAVMMDSSRG
jgi:hypothetical protein